MDNGFDINELHKEIDLIQGCVTRMSDNSFKLKEYYVTLMVVVVTVLLSQECSFATVGAVSLIVTCVFWGLDAFYLKMETLYRWKYEWLIKERKQGETKHLYNLDPYNKEMWIEPRKKRQCIIHFIFSKSLFPMYGTVAIIAVLLIPIALIGLF